MILKENEYLSDISKQMTFKKDYVNLIHAGTRTGKSYFAINGLCELLGIESSEIVFITSRKISKKQFLKDIGTCCVNKKNKLTILNQWDYNKESKINKVCILTYHQFFYLLRDETKQNEFMKNVKSLVFDEIHCIFTDLFFGDLIIAVREHIISQLNNKNKWIIAITATPSIMIESEYFKIHNVLGDDFVCKYQAENITLVNKDAFFAQYRYYRNQGKVLILVETKKEALNIQNQI